MSPKQFLKRSLSITVCALAVTVAPAVGQSTEPTPVKVVNPVTKPMAVAGRTNLYCAGYVQSSPINKENRIVNAVEEQDQFNYAQNNVVYINMGASQGVSVGDMLAVVRPKKRVSTRWARKDNLGFYVQEVGALEVIRVRDNLSVARINTSCDSFRLGDLVQPMAERTSPMHQNRGMLDRFADASGKATGRVFMARDDADAVSRDQIVYVDLGSEDNVRVGDYLTVYRPLDKRRGFQNDLRKVVGELVVLNVKEKTATAVITRTAQEIHRGDWVELQ